MRGVMGLAVLVVLLGSSCMPRGPILDTGSKPASVGGTISGMVRPAGGTMSLTGRKVTAINLSSGQRFETSTAANGGYTIKVPVGKYKLEVELREGESLAAQPAETEISASDMDADRDFTITVRSPY
jgi:Carboxypeptidase regulatory-like domain